MILIERFIFNRVFGSTVIALAGFTLIALLTQVIRRVNLLTQTTEALTAFLNFAVLMIPTVALVVLPFAVLLGSARTLVGVDDGEELVGQGVDPRGEVVRVEVPLLVPAPREPGDVEGRAEHDHPLGAAQGAGAQAFLVRGVEPHHHEHLVGAPARVGLLGTGREDLHAVAHPVPQQALGDLGRARVVADEEHPRHLGHRHHLGTDPNGLPSSGTTLARTRTTAP